MKAKQQKPIYFFNACNCVIDYNLLEGAILWYSKDIVFSKRKIYLHGNYPCVSIYNDKQLTHRLIMSFVLKRILKSNEYVHHIDKNTLNCSIDNLQLMNDSEHQSLHNKGKVLSMEHRAKISFKNKSRIVRYDITRGQVYKLKSRGMSFDEIATFFNTNTALIKRRYKSFINIKTTK